MMLRPEHFKKFLDFSFTKNQFMYRAQLKISEGYSKISQSEVSSKKTTSAKNLSSSKSTFSTLKSMFQKNKISNPKPIEKIEAVSYTDKANEVISYQLKRMTNLMKNKEGLILGEASPDMTAREFADPIAALIALHVAYGDVDVTVKEHHSEFTFTNIKQDDLVKSVDFRDQEEPYTDNYVVEDLLIDLIRYYPELTDFYLRQLIKDNKIEEIKKIRDLLNILEKHIPLKTEAMTSKGEKYEGTEALEKIKTLTQMLNEELLTYNLDQDLEEFKNLNAPATTTSSLEKHGEDKSKKRRNSNDNEIYKEPKNDIYMEALKKIEKEYPQNKKESEPEDLTAMFFNYNAEQNEYYKQQESSTGDSENVEEHAEDLSMQYKPIYMHVFSYKVDEDNKGIAILRKYQQNNAENSYIQLNMDENDGETQLLVLQIGEISKDGTVELTLLDGYDEYGEDITKSCVITLSNEKTNALVAGYYEEGIPGYADDDYTASKNITIYKDPDISTSASYKV